MSPFPKGVGGIRMYTYNILCEKCGKEVGSVSFGTEPSAEKLATISTGYICSECLPISLSDAGE